MCQDGLDLLERSGRDFRLLRDRIDEQRKFGLDQTSGISWEVRNVRAVCVQNNRREKYRAEQSSAVQCRVERQNCRGKNRPEQTNRA